jgi:hypothetical protein
MLVVTQSDLKIWQLGTDLQTWTEIPEPVIPYTLPIASSTVLGGVKVDGTSITISNGFISSTPYTLPTASDLTLGGIKVGSGLAIDGAGVLSTTPSGINILNPTNFYIGSCAPGAFEPIDNKISLSGQTCNVLSKVGQQRGPITSLDVVLSLGTIFNDLTGSVKVTIGSNEYTTPFSATTSEPYDMIRHNVVTFPTLDALTYYYITVTINGSNPLNGSQWYIIGVIAS